MQVAYFAIRHLDFLGSKLDLRTNEPKVSEQYWMAMGAKLQVPEANRYEPVLPSMQRPTHRAYVAIGLAAAHPLSLHAEGLVAAAVVFATGTGQGLPNQAGYCSRCIKV